MKLKDSFHFYALITIFCWSLAYVFTRLALPYFSAFSLGFLRYLAASGTLVVVAMATKMRLPRRADLPWFIATGAAGFFLYIIAFNKGCETLPAAASSVIISSAPVTTALMARFVYGEKLSLCRWLAIALEFSGVLVMALMSGGFTVNTGLLWLIVAVLLFSAYNLLQRRLTKTYSALQTATFSIFAGTLMLAIFLPSSLPQLRAAPSIQLFYLAILGIFPSAIAYAAWAQAFAKAKQASSASNYMFLIPFVTALMGFLIIRETPGPATMVGGGIILLGLALFNFGDKVLAKSRKLFGET